MSKSAHNLMNVELYEMVKMLLLQMGSQNNHQHEVDNIPSPKLSTCLRKSPATYTNAQIVLQGDGDGWLAQLVERLFYTQEVFSSILKSSFIFHLATCPLDEKGCYPLRFVKGSLQVAGHQLTCLRKARYGLMVKSQVSCSCNAAFESCCRFNLSIWSW